MCLLLSADDVYRTMAELLCVNDDLLFVSVMVRNLNIILLTATELFELRGTLKEVSSEVRLDSSLDWNLRRVFKSVNSGKNFNVEVE